MRRAALAIAVLVLGACAELPEVQPDTCGNGVIEGALAEECDGADGCGAADGANACKFVCDGAGAGCPEGGYQCGADGRCRLPTETFAASGVEVAGAYGVSAADMDGDGAADLLGYDSRGLLIRWGDGDGTLAASTRVALPFQLQPTQTPDVDGNGHRDLTMPIADIGYGLFMADGGRGVVPAAQDAISLEFGAPCVEVTVGSIRTDGSLTGTPQLLVAIGGVILSFLEGDGCDSDPGLDCVLSAEGGPLVDGMFISGRLGYGPFQGVIADEQFSAAVVGQSQISVWGESSGPVLRPERIATWTLDEPLASDAHIGFGHADGDECPDLVVDTGTGGSLQVIYSQPVLGICAGFAASRTRHDRPGGRPLGRGDLDGDGLDEILMAVSFLDGGIATEVLFPYHPAPDRSGWGLGAPITQFQDPPTSAVVLDYNHDGWNDLVVTYDGVETVDFFLNYEGVGYSRFPIDVGGVPRTPVVGDFDGDLLDDIVLAAADPTDPEGRDRTVVIYGEADGRPIGAQFLGDFVADATPVHIEGGVQPTTDSVLVVSNKLSEEVEECDSRLAVLIGDTSRQPVSPFIHLFPSGSGQEPLFPTGVIDISQQGVPRVLALGLTFSETPGDPPDIGLSVLEFEGTSYSSIGVSAKIPAAELSATAAVYAFWRAGDLDGDFQPEAIALVNGRAVVARFDGAALDVELTTLPDELAGPQWFDLVDMDGDGDLDLLGSGGDPVEGEGAGDPVPPAGTIWVVSNQDGALDFGDPALVAVPGSLYCVGADTIISDTTGLPQVVGACYHTGGDPTGGVIAIGTFDPEAEEIAAVRILPIEGDPIAVEVDDFTGDGLDDIAVLGSQTVTVYRHCRADEVFFGSCTGLDLLP